MARQNTEHFSCWLERPFLSKWVFPDQNKPHTVHYFSDDDDDDNKCGFAKLDD